MPTGPKGEKRPADVIGNAVRVAQIATGEADTRESRIVRERIKESWEALKREWIGKGHRRVVRRHARREAWTDSSAEGRTDRSSALSPVNADAGLEDTARAYLAAAQGFADRVLRLALSDAREALEAASARISFAYVRGRLPIGPEVPVAKPNARASVAAP